SIVAWSDSSVTSGSSALTVSPVLTNTSMTGTSLKSPMSGTLTSCVPPLFVAGGGDCGVAAGAGFGLAGCGAPAPAPSVSSVRITPPSLTLSPTRSLRSLTTPADGEGTSMVALSDSSVISESSGFTASPGFTNTSITGTSLKSPISGTLTSTVLIVGVPASNGPRRRLLRVEPVFRHGLGRFRGGQLAIVGQRLERGDRHPVAVDFEEVAELLARIGAAE